MGLRSWKTSAPWQRSGVRGAEVTVTPLLRCFLLCAEMPLTTPTPSMKLGLPGNQPQGQGRPLETDLSPCLRGSQRKCWFVLKEEEVHESKVLRHQGGCGHSLEKPRNAGSGTGFPVALEWNAHYSYLDSKREDPRRLENNPVKQGPSQDKEWSPAE